MLWTFKGILHLQNDHLFNKNSPNVAMNLKNVFSCMSPRRNPNTVNTVGFFKSKGLSMSVFREQLFGLYYTSCVIVCEQMCCCF